KVVADKLMIAAGVQVLYHTQIADVLTEAGNITGVVIANKAGLSVISPRFVVDATGDADVAGWAGAKYDVHADHQPMGLHFRVAGAEKSDDIREKCAAVLACAHNEGVLGLYGGTWISLLESGEVNFNATRFPDNPL